uniref:Uncharacterized protein n=1 Tax=Arundo donax TaxID=35708 RepID=A0A0A9A9V2_ARUDO
MDFSTIMSHKAHSWTRSVKESSNAKNGLLDFSLETQMMVSLDKLMYWFVVVTVLGQKYY